LSNFEIGFELVENEVTFVDRLQVGSEEAFETLMLLYQAPIYNIAYRVLGDPAEAADAVQETFMKIFKGIKTFRGESGLKTWIYRIAISESLNRQRWWKRWRRRAPFSIDDRNELDPSASRLLEIADSGPTPEAVCAKIETEQAVQQALNSLAFDHRIVIVLRDIEGLSYEEIAETLHLSLGTVKSRLWRGRLELKKKLESYITVPQPAASERLAG
jgi:RNA polymerase sigma-70 factor (ECF subfamily)